MRAFEPGLYGIGHARGEPVGADEEQVLEALQAGGAYRAVSFDAPRGAGADDEPATLADSVGIDEEGFERAEERATLDNLLKGAASQAVQNLNLCFGLPELAGIEP